MSRLGFLPQLAAGFGMPVIITGATGWLGRAALEMLDSHWGEVMPQHVTAFASARKTIPLRSGRLIEALNMRDLAKLQTPPALVFHFAFLTREHASSMPLDAYIAANQEISGIVSAFVRRSGARGLVVPSSGAVYGGETLASNPYGVLKRDDEQVFAALARRLGFPAAIIRVFNLSGPFINKLHSYALACIIADVQRGGPVNLRAAHPVFRSYTHVADVLNIAAAMILRGMNVPVFDAAGTEAIEIGDLASRAAHVLGAADTRIIRPAFQNGASDHYLGDIPAFARLAESMNISLCPLDRQILETSAYIEALSAKQISAG